MSSPPITKPRSTPLPLVDQPPPGSDAQGAAGKQRSVWRRKLLHWIVPATALLIGVLMVLPELLQKWLWMRQVEYAGIFWTLLSVKWTMACVAFIGAFLFLWINIRQAAKNSFALAEDAPAPNGGSLAKAHVIEIRGIPISLRAVKRTVAFITAAVAAFFAMGISTRWDTYLRFRYGDSVGFPEPVFGVDVGFYLFRLPFYQLVQASLVSLTALATAAVVSLYAYSGISRLRGGRQLDAGGNAVPHLSMLLFILAATFGWGYYLERFDLLYSTMGVVYGVGYTADHVTVIALWFMIGVSALACALLVLNVFRPRWKAMAIGASHLCGGVRVSHRASACCRSKTRGATKRTQAGNSLFEELH